ncbi:hypothetical protein [Mesorhizobium sp. M0047]|uniref:hypothetical protein n=1 Tax=Mesorhizobium sp. M0047 TaxID=2956859 RepID=UPI003339F3D4
MAAPAVSATSSTSFLARLCASAVARRNQAGTVAIGAVEGAPRSAAWWRGESLGRRIIESRMNHGGAFGNENRQKALRLSRIDNER